MNAPENAVPILMREFSDGVATLTLNRPGQFNSLSEEMLTDLQAALDAIGSDAAVRAVVVAGAGKAFCAGHDLKQMRANHSKAYMRKLFKQCGKVMMTITGMPQQVIKPDGLNSANTRFGLYRWHVMDPIRFKQDLRVTMQALGWRMALEGKMRYLALQDDIASTAFWYQVEPHVAFRALPAFEYLEVI